MGRHPLGFVWLLAVVAGLGGCSTSTHGLKLYRGQPGEAFAEPRGESVEVTYLGVSGYVVRRGQDTLMFAPSITNPSLPALVLSRIQTDRRKVDRCMRRVPPIRDVEWMLVGHAHYDHLMDVPYFMERYAPASRLLGSATVTRMLASVLPAHRRLEVDSRASRNGAMGQWLYNHRRTMRVMPIESEHSPHFLGLKLLPAGQLDEGHEPLPWHVLGWKEGQTYAYLVDFLHPDGSVAFRLHFQDAASNPTLGFVPPEALDEHPVDLALLCVGASEQVDSYPERFLEAAKPRHVILGHWEDFFGNDCDREPEVVFTLGKDGLEDFIQRVDDSPSKPRRLLPVPFSRMYLPVEP